MFNYDSDSFNLSNEDFARFRTLVLSIHTIAISLIRSIRSTLPAEPTEIVNIKLPETKSLDDLIKTFDSLNKAFSQLVLNDTINGTLQVEAFEPGSKWIKIFLGTQLAVSIIGTAAWSAAVVSKKMQEGQYIEEMVRSRELSNKFIEDLREAEKQYLDMLITAEAQHLYNEKLSDESPEQIERLKYSIKLLAELINKGTEFHPSLTAPETVENLFPKNKPVNLIESRTKMLNQDAGPSSNQLTYEMLARN